MTDSPVLRIIAAVLLISLASGIPSDDLKYRDSPGTVSLSGVDPVTPKLFATQDGNLSAFALIQVPNFGHYCTWEVNTNKGDELPAGMPESLQQFTTSSTENLTNVGNASTENVTIINDTVMWF